MVLPWFLTMSTNVGSKSMMEFNLDEGEFILSGGLIKEGVVSLQPPACMKLGSHLPAQVQPQEK